jgi:hypothetical protein
MGYCSLFVFWPCKIIFFRSQIEFNKKNNYLGRFLSCGRRRPIKHGLPLHQLKKTSLKVATKKLTITQMDRVGSTKK